jgi:hypothetical protein
MLSLLRAFHLLRPSLVAFVFLALLLQASAVKGRRAGYARRLIEVSNTNKARATTTTTPLHTHIRCSL